MFKLKWQSITAIFGILIMVFGISLVVFWETYGRDNFLFREVYVLKTNVEKGTLIKEDMLTTLKYEDNTLISNPLLRQKDLAANAAVLNQIIGKEAKQFIPKHAQLTADYFEDADIVLNKDQFVFKVPSDWLLAFPSSLRRKDNIYFYAIGSTQYKNEELQSWLSEQNNSSTDKTNASDATSTTGESSTQPGTNNDLTIQQFNKELQGMMPLLNTTVAYVKDSANREVVTIGEIARYDGSSQISSIEIIATLEQVNNLTEEVKKGNRFILLYQD